MEGARELLEVEQQIVDGGNWSRENLKLLEKLRWKVGSEERKRRREEARKSLKTLDSCEDGRDPGEDDFVRIFPQELWGVVLKKLGDTKEWLRVSRLNSLWYEDVLGKKHASALFGEVFPILHKHKYLDQNDILQCRLVCKAWKSAIGAYLENYLAPSGYNPDDDVDSSMPGGVSPACALTRGPAILEVHEQTGWYLSSGQMTSTARFPVQNPFISRYLMLMVPIWMDRNMDYLEKITGMITEYGKEVHHVLLFFDRSYENEMLFATLAYYLRQMPNLRSLAVNFNGLYKASPCISEDELDWESVTKIALPVLPHLVKLTTSLVPHFIVNLLLQRFTSVKELVVLPDYNDLNNWKGNTNLPSLTSYSCLDDISGFAKSHWPYVDTLSMKFFRHPETHLVTVFDGINKFSRTLRHLTLSFHMEVRPFEKVDAAMLRTLWLHLPRLETLSLSVYRIPLNKIDFILPLKNLRVLNLRYFKKKTTEKAKIARDPGSTTASAGPLEEIIQFTGYANRLYESNIWRLLPHLDTVTVKVITLDHNGFQEVVVDERKGLVKEKVYSRSSYQKLKVEAAEDNK